MGQIAHVPIYVAIPWGYSPAKLGSISSIISGPGLPKV